MKRTFAIVFSLLFLFSCTQQPVPGKIKEENATIVNSDREFRNVCMDRGMSDASVYYTYEDVIQLREGQRPLISRKQLKATYTSKKKNHSLLSLEIVNVEIARTDDLGYTFSNWKYTTQTIEGKDTTIYGNYITVWKKQPDGTWRYVIDGENTSPPPKIVSS